MQTIGNSGRLPTHSTARHGQLANSKGPPIAQATNSRSRNVAAGAASVVAPTKQLQTALEHPSLKAAAEGSEQLKMLYAGLAAAHERASTATNLEAKPTKISSDGQTTYGTEDGSTIIQFLVSKGDNVDWLVTSVSALSVQGGQWEKKLGMEQKQPKAAGGLARMTGYSAAGTQAPHLHYELGIVAGQLILYYNLAARVNLLLDDEYFKKFYQRPTGAGACMADLELQLQGDTEFSPFRSKSADVRMLAGPTGLLYTAPASVENVQKGVELGRQVTELWLEFIGDPSNSVPEAKQAEIEAHDCVLYEFQRKDPGNAIIVGLLGAEKTEELLQLSCKDARILL